MCPISYTFLVAFHPSLNLDRLFLVRRFNHTFEQLNSVSYLLDKMLPYFDLITVQQLRDCAQAVHEKREKFLLSEMFSCKLKFVMDLLKKSLAEKYYRRYKELDFFSKQKFKIKNPVDWEKTNCVICNFLLPMSASNFPCEKITTYLDFVIFVEHSFITNMFEHEKLKMSKSIQTLENYHQAFRKMLQIVALLNTNSSSDSVIEDISDNCVAEFAEKIGFDNFNDLCFEIENM